jgi:predicted ThiF/HesA family dinucleotide-utilizing enzyme
LEILFCAVSTLANLRQQSAFKAALKQTFVDEYLTTDLSAKIEGIQDAIKYNNCNVITGDVLIVFLPVIIFCQSRPVYN